MSKTPCRKRQGGFLWVYWGRGMVRRSLRSLRSVGMTGETAIPPPPDGGTPLYTRGALAGRGTRPLRGCDDRYLSIPREPKGVTITAGVGDETDTGSMPGRQSPRPLAGAPPFTQGGLWRAVEDAGQSVCRPRIFIWVLPSRLRRAICVRASDICAGVTPSFSSTMLKS